MASASAALRAAATGNPEDVGTAIAATNGKPKGFPEMLTAWLPEIRRALPKHMNADRMSRIALTAFRKTPKLGQCDPRSVFAAVIQSSQLGLEIDTLGRAYLVPYDKNTKKDGKWTKTTECQLIPGWKGLVDLMNRSGQGSVWTGAAFIGDEFDWQLGDSPFVHHKPRGEDDPEKLTHVYAIGRVKGADWPIIEVWPIEKVIRHRDRYNKVGDKHYSYGNWEMYARKVPLLQVLKYMPCSVELATAMTLNDAAEIGGEQNLTIKDAIEGSWTEAHATAGIDTDTGEIEERDGTLDIKETSGTSFDAHPVAWEAFFKQVDNARTAEELDYCRTLLRESFSDKYQPEGQAAIAKRAGEIAAKSK
jgi:recombination protein RecT